MTGKDIWGWIKALAFAVIIALVIRGFVLAFYVVDGNSMLPSLSNGQLVAVNKLAYRIGEPHRGDVVVFHKESREAGDKAFIKRIIALPGDTIAIQEGVIYLNGQPIEEDYIDAVTQDVLDPLLIEEDMIFVMGDNRTRYGSWDSRDFGPIPLDTILGRADAVIFPVPGKID